MQLPTSKVVQCHRHDNMAQHKRLWPKNVDFKDTSEHFFLCPGLYCILGYSILLRKSFPRTLSRSMTQGPRVYRFGQTIVYPLKAPLRISLKSMPAKCFIECQKLSSLTISNLLGHGKTMQDYTATYSLDNAFGTMDHWTIWWPGKLAKGCRKSYFWQNFFS